MLETISYIDKNPDQVMIGEQLGNPAEKVECYLQSQYLDRFSVEDGSHSWPNEEIPTIRKPQGADGSYGDNSKLRIFKNPNVVVHTVVRKAGHCNNKYFYHLIIGEPTQILAFKDGLLEFLLNQGFKEGGKIR